MSFFRKMSREKKIVLAVVAFFFFVLFSVAGTAYYLVVSNYNNIGNLLKVASYLRRDALQPLTFRQLVDGAIKGMVGALEDPYSTYLEPSTYRELSERMRGAFGGVGIYVGVKNNLITVISPIKGSPAEKAGIMSGDVIVAIDGKETRGMSLDKAVELMRGPEGTKVKVTVHRQGVAKPLEFVLTRRIIEVPTVEWKMVEGTRIGYLHIAMFNTRTPRETEEALRDLKKQGMEALILDLRDNPGGELEAAVETAGYFVPKGPVVYIDYRRGTDEVMEARGGNINLPLVVLVNEGSASAAEIVAGAIKDRGQGTLVGTRTFGKGVVQSVFQLYDGAGLKLTTARYLTPARTDINKKGVQPHVVVKQPEGEAEDLQLKKAVEILQTKYLRAAG